MTWFWFILFGIIGLAKRDQFAKQIATWQPDSLLSTTWFCLLFWGVMGLFMLPFNEGHMWLMHIGAGFCGVLGFFTLNEYMKRSTKHRSEQELERIRKLRMRLRNADTPPQDDTVVEPVERGIDFREDPAEYGLVDAEDAKDPRPVDQSARLLEIMQRMAQQSDTERSEPEGQPEDSEPVAEPDAEETPREARKKTFSVDLDLGGLLSDKPAFVDQDHAGVDLTAPMDPSPTVQDERPLDEDEPALPAADLEEEEAAKPSEPEPVPVAATESKPSPGPQPPGPVEREGYTPGPTTLGGSSGPISTGPVTLGKPGKAKVRGPRKLKPGFTYKPKLVDPVISPERATSTKND